jgi:UDP-N-acetylmuramoylalanine--D-glutamate ligase
LVEYNIGILGGGESGVGTAILAKHKNLSAFLSDGGKIKTAYAEELKDYGIAFEENGHTTAILLSCKEIIKSPGIPDHAEIIQTLKAAKIPVISELEFAARYCNAKKICITGSNGKTTTTLLTYHILKNAGLNVGLAGNVGKSYARQVAEKNHDHYVLEISSFQLDGMYEFKADIAILTNITPDHLDRYEYKFNNYIQSKMRIIQNQSADDALIYFADDHVISEAIEKIKPVMKLYPYTLHNALPFGESGAFIENENLTIQINPNNQFSMKMTELALQGKHNLANSMAAGIAARILDLRKELIRESLENFDNVEHRLEFVSKVNGISFINDSKATNVNSTWYALESMKTPTVWIAGGQDKGNDYRELLPLVSNKVKAIVCLTKDSKKIRAAFDKIVEKIIDVQTAEQAVKVSYDLAREGDSVLLSPACASFDLFENYEDRGRQFKAAVRRL